VGANWQWGELTLNQFKYTQYGRSVEDFSIRPTIYEVFPGNVSQSSGKMTTRETTFWESDHPGIVFQGKKPSGKRPYTFNFTILCYSINSQKLDACKKLVFYSTSQGNCEHSNVLWSELPFISYLSFKSSTKLPVLKNDTT